ncbi:hypothetical protein GII36_01855 [Candidatus Mycosynbacter amalyticus]|uniref:Cell division protein FtsQ n=1 Tax=Candidatus Mycosynbacter amalyticus TaxID=2665156 RepID=A0A857MJ72_9BACT|nr:hypothetical protein [Candidatus Mycosynbacter amalyticus]QHN42593.1 hypothetical protein GII36_01855 [Candidatus Mycosynbacter amalyticus]
MPRFSRKSGTDVGPPRRRRSVEDAGSPARKDSLYMRGRTLAGATSHTLRSAEPRALSNATPREKVHHLTNLRRRLTLVLSMSLGVIILLMVFLYQFTAGVQVGFSGARPASSSEYEQAIQEYLSQNPLERLRFNLDADKLNTFVNTKLPEVEQVSVGGYTGPVTSGFDITLRKPVVSWNVDDKTYFVDSHGVSFTKNIYENPTVTIVDNSGVEHTSGTAIASERFLTFVGKVVAQAEANGHKVTKVAIPAGTSRQVELYVEGHDYPVIMSIDRSAGEQAEDMARSIAYFDKQGRKPKYLDIRVKGKVFFRE